MVAIGVGGADAVDAPLRAALVDCDLLDVAPPARRLDVAPTAPTPMPPTPASSPAALNAFAAASSSPPSSYTSPSSSARSAANAKSSTSSSCDRAHSTSSPPPPPPPPPHSARAAQRGVRRPGCVRDIFESSCGVFLRDFNSVGPTEERTHHHSTSTLRPGSLAVVAARVRVRSVGRSVGWPTRRRRRPTGEVHHVDLFKERRCQRGE